MLIQFSLVTWLTFCDFTTRIVIPIEDEPKLPHEDFGEFYLFPLTNETETAQDRETYKIESRGESNDLFLEFYLFPFWFMSPGYILSSHDPYMKTQKNEKVRIGRQ